MTEPRDPRTLDLCAVGLGQGGGNLAAEWRRRGYRAVLFNTARADLKALSHHEGLDVPDKSVVDIGLDGHEGAGKDPDYGVACIGAHVDEIRAAVEKQLKGADALLLCAGLGGGTGSALPELIRALAPLEVPLVTVTSLPSRAESGIAKVNAVKTANAVIASEVAGRIFVDNDRLMAAFPELDLVSYFPAVNARVMAPLDELNRLNRRDDLWSVRTFDGEDLRKVLLSGGVLETYVAKLAADGSLDVQYLVDVVAAGANGGDLDDGVDLGKVAYLALIVVGPESALRATSMRVFDDAISELKQRTAGGAVYEGIYVAPEGAPLKAFVLTASFSLPARVNALLGEARSEGQELANKVREDIAPLEVGGLDGLELFRSTAKRPSAGKARPPAPEPRSLGEQLLRQVKDLTKPRATEPPPIALDDLSQPSDAYRPVVGTGRYDDDVDDLEPTRVAYEDEAVMPPPASPPPSPRGMELTEALAAAPRPVTGAQLTSPSRPKTSRAARLPDDVSVRYVVGDGFSADGPVTDPVVRKLPESLPESPHEAIGDDDGGDDGLTKADARPPAAMDDLRVVLSSIGSGGGGAELQSVYEDLVERYRQAADRRDKDRIVRRLVDDSAADDVEVRALAVWAMVKLTDPVFRRPLLKSAEDGNPEIARMAREGALKIPL